MTTHNSKFIKFGEHNSPRATYQPTNLQIKSFRPLRVPLDLLIIEIDPHHSLSQSTAHLRKHNRITVVSHGLNNRTSAPRRITALENPRPDENTIAAQLHHQRGVGGGGYTAGGEVDHRKPPELLRLHHQIIRSSDFLSEGEDLIVVHVAKHTNIAHDGSNVTHRLDDVAGAGLALGADHGGAFADTAEGFAKVAAAADEGDAEVVFVDVVVVVSDSEDFALVDVVDANRLEDLSLDEVADSGLGHDRDGDGLLDLLDELGVAHAGDAALGTDVGRDAFQGHDGAGAGLLRDASLVSVDDVHDDSAAEHLGEAYLH
ncbi:hypothetical protein HYC85_031686 [Camellia sinensis]|uniref:Uncharacterized protein n=1 Tax=Camellia sinensis TaxID=4442 RepID=A0A7J7FR66_CAMSI|nr:hypothetical protein HYC85_031686 [Camellia sinensis]